MENKFDSSAYPTSEPQSLVTGDFWTWTRPDISATYPVDTFTLKYRFTSLTDVQTQVTITAKKIDDAHVVEASSNDNEKISSGMNRVSVCITRDSDSAEITIDEFDIDIKSKSGDMRSHALKVLDAINATIEKTATKEQASYSVAGRSLSRRSITELLELKSVYERKVARENRARDRARGKAKSRNVLITMKA